MPPYDFIKRLITSTYDGETLKKIGAVPAMETIPVGLFSKIQQYENVHYNIYDLNFYNMSSFIPLNSSFCVVKLTQGVLDLFKIFYSSKINLYASIEYHDCKVSMCLAQLGYKVTYFPIVEGKTMQKYITYGDLLSNYSKKLQGHLLMNYDLFFSELLSCTNCNPITKIILSFHFLGTFFEFTFPCFCLMVLYTIFFEGFGLTINGNAATFFMGLYIIIVVLFGFISLIGLNNTKNSAVFTILYIVYEIYLLIALLTSIAAMHYVRINKTQDPYKFNTAAIVILILFNFIFGILPMIFHFQKIISNIVEMLLYLVLGAPNYTSFFLIHGIVNMSDGYGKGTITDDGLNQYQRKSVVVIIWFLVNGLLSFFVLLMKDRTSRVNCVLALAIIFTIYNIVKMGTIVWSKLFFINANESLTTNMRNIEGIKQEIEKYETEKPTRDVSFRKDSNISGADNNLINKNELISSERKNEDNYQGYQNHNGNQVDYNIRVEEEH